MAKSVTIEWQFFEETQTDDAAWQQACASSNSQPAAVPTRKWWHSHLASELALVAVITTALFWLHPWQRPAPAPQRLEAKPQSFVTLKTAFFQINYRPQDVKAVQIVATSLDSRYTRLRRTLGLAAPAEAGRLTINVGISPETSTGLAQSDMARCRQQGEVLLRCQATDYPARLGAEFTVPASVLAQSGLPGPAAQLAGSVQDWLTGRIFDEAVQRITIQPMWQPLVGGLRHYFWLKQQNKRLWQIYQNNPALWPDLWPRIGTLPLQAAFPDDLKYRAQNYQWSSPAFKVGLDANVLSLAITGSQAEYLVTTYGRESLPRLLEGFGRYDSWEKLSPAVFGVSARQLEDDWHGYLASLSPASNSITATESVELVRYQLNANADTLGLTR